MAEDRRAEVPQPATSRGGDEAPSATHPMVQLPSGAPAAASVALASAAAAAIRKDEVEMVLLESQMRSAVSAQPPGDAGAVGQPGGDSEVADVEGLSAVAEGSGGTEGGGEGGATGPLYVCIPDEERMELEGDFLELMQVCCAARPNFLSPVFAFVGGLHGPGPNTQLSSCSASICDLRRKFGF